MEGNSFLIAGISRGWRVMQSALGYAKYVCKAIKVSQLRVPGLVVALVLFYENTFDLKLFQRFPLDGAVSLLKGIVEQMKFF